MVGLLGTSKHLLITSYLLTLAVAASSSKKSRSSTSTKPREQAGRIRCHSQSVCDNLRQPRSRGSMRIPINSECVLDGRSGQSFCGYSGAACSSDLQCDFGRCSGSVETPGICLGGLGDSCEGPDGPDDALCAGNLGCSGQVGDGSTAVCGGIGAECLYSGHYVPGSTPNNAACVSGYCDPSSLACDDPFIVAARPRAPSKVSDDHEVSQDRTPSPDDFVQVVKEQQVRIIPDATPSPSARLSAARVPDGMVCPKGLSACPLRSDRSSSGHVFGCVDTSTTVSQCGGCSMSAGEGTSALSGSDCLALPGVASVACIQSRCKIFSCAPAFEFDRSGLSCRPKRYWR